MDPLTTISLLSNIISFVDWGTKVVSGARKIYISTSGALAENESRETLVREIHDFISKLKIPDGPAEQNLRSLTDECRRLAHAILEKLQSIRPATPQSKLGAIWSALKSERAQNELERLEGRLGRCRDELSQQLSFITGAHDRDLWLKIQEDLEKNASRFEAFRHQLDQLQNSFRSSSDSVLSAHIQSLLHLEEDVFYKIAQSRILASLSFDEQSRRADAVEVANEKTLHWLVSDTPLYDFKERERTKLLNWLSEGSGIFHVMGKPGSGKSTLMKFLANHERVSDELENWAGSDDLCIIQFYFWKPGSRLQNTLHGFYRSVVHDILQAYPDLIAETFPQQWEEALKKSWAESPISQIQGDDIHKGFNSLISNDNLYDGRRLCIFVDGLDEHRGTTQEDHTDLVHMLRRLTSQRPHGLKICASSREEHVFLNELARHRPDHRLRLHKLTEQDIRDYITDRLRCVQNELIQEQLRDSIVERSCGIFLWVALVVRNIRDQIDSSQDSWHLLEEVKTFPTELEPLFKKLLESQKRPQKCYLTLAMLLALTEAHDLHEETPLDEPNPSLRLTPLAYYRFDDYEQDPTFALREVLVSKFLSDESLSRMEEQGCQYMNRYCQGLVEVVEHTDGQVNQSIEFIHRSIPEFLQQDWAQDKISRHAKNFNAIDAVSQLFLAALKLQAESETHIFGHRAINEIHQQLPTLLKLRRRYDMDTLPYQYLDALQQAAVARYPWGLAKFSVDVMPDPIPPSSSTKSLESGLDNLALIDCTNLPGPTKTIIWHQWRKGWEGRTVIIHTMPEPPGTEANPNQDQMRGFDIDFHDPLYIAQSYGWTGYFRWRLAQDRQSVADSPFQIARLIYGSHVTWSAASLDTALAFFESGLATPELASKLTLISCGFHGQGDRNLTLWENFAVWLFKRTAAPELFTYYKPSAEDVVSWRSTVPDWLAAFHQYGADLNIEFTMPERQDFEQRIFIVVHAERPVLLSMPLNGLDGESVPTELLSRRKARCSGVRISLRGWVATSPVLDPETRSCLLAAFPDRPDRMRETQKEGGDGSHQVDKRRPPLSEGDMESKRGDANERQATDDDSSLPDAAIPPEELRPSRKGAGLRSGILTRVNLGGHGATEWVYILVGLLLGLLVARM